LAAWRERGRVSKGRAEDGRKIRGYKKVFEGQGAIEKASDMLSTHRNSL